MELAQAYREIEERLERIDFPALFRGFSRFPFALYDGTRAYMGDGYFDKPGNFVGNTSLKYQGEHTAIWQLTDNVQDYDVLASKLVHEMLHAYQNAAGEKRWADERQALVKYRYDAENLSARLAEAACMRAALTGDAPEAFSRLQQLRKARMERFPYAFDYEARIEQIEGTAHFVELSALRQLDESKAEQRWEKLLSSLSDPAQYFPVRSVTYLSGAAMIACLKKYTDADTDRFTETPFAVAALEQAQPCALPGTDEGMVSCLSAWRGKARETAARALDKGEIVLEGPYRLVVWNIYDGYWDGKYAVLSNFLGYVEGELPQTDEELFARIKFIQGDFVAELDEELRIIRVWRQ